MKIAVLASGSNGNASVLITKTNMILIDDGISCKALMERMNQCGLEMSQIDSIFLTHEHVDHTAGLKVLLKKIQADCYISEGTLRGVNTETRLAILNQNIIPIKGNDVLALGDTKITVVKTHHDAKEPVGFVFEEDGKKLIYITDTGYIDQSYYPLLTNADMYVLESNFDTGLLYASGRPFELKQRIAGDHGHISNEDSAIILANIMGNKTHTVVRAHISNDCNFYHEPKLIEKTHQQVYEEFGLDTSNIKFVYGSREGVTGVFEV